MTHSCVIVSDCNSTDIMDLPEVIIDLGMSLLCDIERSVFPIPASYNCSHKWKQYKEHR